MRKHNIKYILNEYQKLGMLEKQEDKEYHISSLESFSNKEIEKIKFNLLIADRQVELLDIQKHLETLLQDNNYYNFIDNYYKDKNDSQYSKEYYQDIMRFLLFVYLCVNRSYTDYIKHKQEKESLIKHRQSKDKLVMSLKENIENIEQNYKNDMINVWLKQCQDIYLAKGIDTNTAHQFCKQEINTLLIEYKKSNDLLIEFLEQKEDDFLHIQSHFKKEYNYLLSREVESSNGVRNLYVRYIYCILQICKINNKALVYELTKYLLPQKYLNYLVDNDVYKIIKLIDITNKEQNYLETFDAIYHVMTKRVKGLYNHDMYINYHEVDRSELEEEPLYQNYMKWGCKGLTYNLWKDFIIRQQKKNNINVINNFLF